MLRDTDRDWRLIAEREPYFGVLTADRFRNENLTPQVIDEFYASGRVDIDRAVTVLGSIAPDDFRPEVAVDFGCGVGRLVLAMAEHAGQVIGVDVAEPMLGVAAEQAERRGIANVSWQSDIPASGVDWVNSLIVFQHIAPERGLGLFEQLLASLRPGGFVSLHLTFFRDRRHTGDVERDLADYRYDGRVVELLSHEPEIGPGGMTMYDYDLNRVLRLLVLYGVADLRLEHTDHAGCHGLLFYGRRRLDAPHPANRSLGATAAASAPGGNPADRSRWRRWWPARSS